MVKYDYDRYGRPINWSVEWKNFDDEHRDDLFHSTVGIHESTGILRTCNLIIDHEATINLVSAEVVDNFKLPVITHPYPYSFRWFKDGSKVKVTKQVLIHLKLGNFMDKVLCDIVPMKIHHLLLGMPWLDEKCVMYDGSSTRYYININGTRMRFKSMTQEKAFQTHKEQEVRDAHRENALREENKKLTIEAKCSVVIDENTSCEQFVKKREEPESVNDVGGGILFPFVEEENCSSNIAENSICDNFSVENDEEVVEFLDKLDIFVDTQADIDNPIEKIHVESNLQLVEFINLSDDLIQVPESILSIGDISVDSAITGSISQLKELQATNNYQDFEEINMCIKDEEDTIQVFESVDLSLQVYHPCDEMIQQKTAGFILHLMDVQAFHISFDPFDMYCIPLQFVMADFYEVAFKQYERMIMVTFISPYLTLVNDYVRLFTNERKIFVFDPGGFEDESFSTGRERYKYL